MSIKVSVIVPVYNVEAYLEHCLETLVNQTLQDMEIIVVNDGSTDSSPQIIKIYAEQYPQIIKSYDKANGGLSDARNFGLQYAQGEYVGFVDSDDFVDLNMYEVMYAEAVCSGADIVECNLHHTFSAYEDTEEIVRYTDKQELIAFGCSVAWNKIYKRDWLNNIRVEFPKGINHEDVDFFSLIVPYLRKISYVEQPFVHYVQRIGSINNARSEKLRDIHKVFDHLSCEYQARGLMDEYGGALEALAIRILLGSAVVRFSKVPEKGVRDGLIKDNWRYLNEHYPRWKENELMQRQKDYKSFYYRHCNKFLYDVVAVLLSVKNKK